MVRVDPWSGWSDDWWPVEDWYDLMAYGDRLLGNHLVIALE